MHGLILFCLFVCCWPEWICSFSLWFVRFTSFSTLLHFYVAHFFSLIHALVPFSSPQFIVHIQLLLLPTYFSLLCSSLLSLQTSSLTSCSNFIYNSGVLRAITLAFCSGCLFMNMPSGQSSLLGKPAPTMLREEAKKPSFKTSRAYAEPLLVWNGKYLFRLSCLICCL